MDRRLILRWVAAVARRPDLWSIAVREAFVLAAPGWWRRWPPRPVPDQAYLEWRLQTAYGPDGPTAMAAEDLVSYLEWCRRMRRLGA
jgi:hypothetical protein